MLDAEQLAPDRAGEEILSDIGAKAGREDGERAAAGRDERTSLKLGELGKPGVGNRVTGSQQPAAVSYELRARTLTPGSDPRLSTFDFRLSTFDFRLVTRDS
jgi:hypothetical protein